MIKDVCVYVYNLYTGTLRTYPKVNIVTDKYDTMPDELDYKANIYHIDSDGLLSKYLIFGSEGVVLKDNQSLNYTVWFKDPNPKEAFRLIYEQLCNETEENIRDIERRLDREKQKLLHYKLCLAMFN